MIAYIVGFIYIILSSVYTLSYAGQAWKNGDKRPATGAILLVLLSMAAAILIFLRT